MHILLVRFSSMGDVVLQTATINWLRAFFGKDLSLTFLTSEEFVSLIDHHEGVQKVIGFNRRSGESWKDLTKKIDLLHEENPIDLILDLHATLRSFRLRCSYWTIPALTVDKRRWERFLLTKIKITAFKKLFNANIFGLTFQVERILNDFEAIFGDNRAVRRTQEFRRGPHQELTSLEKLEAYSVEGPYIVLAPSASFFYKRWPIQSFVTLAQTLLEKTTQKVVILAGKDDDFCQEFNKINNPRLINLQGKTNLKESMAILSRSSLSIGNDSGMNHIAEAYGVPCVTLFGPTDPRFGFAPHGNKSVTLSKELYCKPCSTTGKKECYRDRHYCMEMISPQEVLSSALKILEIP